MTQSNAIIITLSADRLQPKPTKAALASRLVNTSHSVQHRSELKTTLKISDKIGYLTVPHHLLDRPENGRSLIQ